MLKLTFSLLIAFLFCKEQYDSVENFLYLWYFCRVYRKGMNCLIILLVLFFVIKEERLKSIIWAIKVNCYCHSIICERRCADLEGLQSLSSNFLACAIWKPFFHLILNSSISKWVIWLISVLSAIILELLFSPNIPVLVLNFVTVSL